MSTNEKHSSNSCVLMQPETVGSQPVQPYSVNGYSVVNGIAWANLPPSPSVKETPITTRIRWARETWLNAVKAGEHHSIIKWRLNDYEMLKKAQAALRAREQRKPIRFTTSDEMAERPRVQPWLVKGIVRDKGVAVIYGPPKIYKSFLVLDLLAHVACGKKYSWFSKKITRQAECIYIPYEGHSGIPDRIAAWKKHHDEYDGINFIEHPFDLTDEDGFEEFIEYTLKQGCAGGVVAIDTAAAAFPGIDENSTQGMGVIVSIAKDLASRLDCLVILVHHSGKVESLGPRGSSSLQGAVDFQIKVAQGKFLLELAKDGKQGAEYHFAVEAVPLGSDEDGVEFDSLVVLPQEGAVSGAAVTFDMAMQVVVDSLKKEDLSRAELIRRAKPMAVSEQKIIDTVKKLEDQKKIERTGSGPQQKFRWVIEVPQRGT